MFELQASLDFYRLYESKIKECDEVIERFLVKYAPQVEVTADEKKQLKTHRKRAGKHALGFNLSQLSYQYFRTDLFAVSGISYNTVLCLLTSLGHDIHKFPNAKSFACWLGLVPNNKVSGGKVISNRRPSGRNTIAKALRHAAVLLAEYGRLIQPPLYQMATDSLLRLRQKRALLRQYHKQRRTLLNLQHSIAVLPGKDSSTEQSLQTMIDSFERAIVDLQQEVCQLCEAEYHEQYQRLLSIKGISHKVATALIETTNGFQDFQSAKAVAKFIGLAPTTFQSGKMSTHRGICRTGDSHLRSMLYVVSWSAIRCNKACREFYQRLKAAGKPSKLAFIAVANKLLRQAFALVRFGEDFNDNYQPKFRSAPCI